MMIRPCRPRDSARPALLTAVRNRRSGLALHPPKENYTALQPLTGAAEYAWGARAGRNEDRRTIFDKYNASTCPRYSASRAQDGHGRTVDLARRARPRRRGQSASWAAHHPHAPAQGELLYVIFGVDQHVPHLENGLLKIFRLVCGSSARRLQAAGAIVCTILYYCIVS